MKNKTFKSSGHGNGKEHVPSKHDANLRKNSFFRFQIGLILSLLAVYGVFQIPFETKTEDVASIEVEHLIQEPESKIYKVVPDQPKPKTTPVPSTPEIEVDVPKFLNDFKQVSDQEDVKEVTDQLASDDQMDAVPQITLHNTDGDGEVEAPEFYDIGQVQEVPVFPGCEKCKTNKEKTDCLSKKINQIVAKNFDTRNASEFGIEGVQRVTVQFQIDENGNVNDIKTRAPYNVLEKEAQRVVEKIPQMTPGKVQNKNVAVRYLLPIVVKIQ
ncbi:energy transducer TonB [Neptunitalea lumnitzerae]|uniref:TonB C-terminal domain-containing protein n=1 Tax=Neptunitalea lumnitzerae TaxID=2965509 RepID=A0ABQ5MNI7_9FLAO|nr:energy transducer TonB [Neptunitalea sp. Y10]GLB50675.1 hypothetical protein Y10_30430 [Neptunitalea sp. Y10]